MTMTVHALAGAAAGTYLGLRGGKKSRRKVFLFILSMVLGHALLDRLPRNHPPVAFDAAGLLVVAVFAGRSGGKADKYASIGMAAAVLPDLFHLLPDRLNLLHPPRLGRLYIGLSPMATQAMTASVLCLLLLAAKYRRRYRESKKNAERAAVTRPVSLPRPDTPGSGL